MDAQVLRELEKTIAKEVPKFQVGYKDESRLMKVCGFLAYPFNPKFMEFFTTTIGSTVYFPTRTFYETNVDSSFEVLTHEYVHLWDKKQNWWFELAYIFPQILALIPLIVFGILAWPHGWLLFCPVVGYLLSALVARKSLVGFWVLLGSALLTTAGLSIWLVGWPTFALAAGLACAAPWPAPWRVKWEMRGYTMSIAVFIWLGGRFTEATRNGYVSFFVGSDYYFMGWSRSSVEKEIDAAASMVQKGTLQGTSPPYATIHNFIDQQGLLRR